MQKNLSIFTAALAYLIMLPFAALAGYSLGYNIGAEVHHKGDMGTGIAAGTFLFFVLPLSVGACAAGVWLIKKILKDIYDTNKLSRIKVYLLVGLGIVLIIGTLYPVLKSSMWQY